jgi:sec-independent protein translocase protein TatA
MNFGNIGFMEILVIGVIVLLLFGAKRLPEIGSSFGKSIREFKSGLSDANKNLRDEYQQSLPREPVAPLSQEEERAREPKRLIT